MRNPDTVFADSKTLTELFPESRTNEFFEALFGDADEGAYDIRLRYGGFDAANKRLTLYLDLHQRPGKCLACNLTSGLPAVFEKHPIINIKGLAEKAASLAEARCTDWRLDRTRQEERERYCIPLILTLADA